MVVLPRERRLRALFAQDAVLLRIQLGAPLLLGLLDFRHHFSLIRVPPYSLATGAGITRVRDGGSNRVGRSLPLRRSQNEGSSRAYELPAARPGRATLWRGCHRRRLVRTRLDEPRGSARRTASARHRRSLPSPSR